MKKIFLLFLSIFTINILNAQSDYIQRGSEQYNIINRLEIKLRTDSMLNFSSLQPFERKQISERIEFLNDSNKLGHLNRIDKYNLRMLSNNNFEWNSKIGDTIFTFKNGIKAYKSWKPAYAGIKTKDFSLFATPLFSFQFGNDNNLDNGLFTNSRGILLRGSISNKIGFYSYFVENQERNPKYVNQWVEKFQALPGAGLIKSFSGNGFDFMDVRGGIMFKVTKGIDVQYAYDRVFIGNGYRSLILSDFAQNFLYLKINTRFWKLNYTNIFAQLNSSFIPGGSVLIPKKYMALHYLDFKVNKWLNLGVFEHVIFGRQNGFDFNYLNPVIFYRAVEQQLGSKDKVTLGINVKANAFKNTQFYGQLIINEFMLKEILNYKKGWWANKQALQIGIKMIDLLKVKNLDLQLEANLVRPFTYSDKDSIGSFSHYNQPLAHPLGANFREFICIVRAQPIPKLNIIAKLFYIEQGLDSAGFNMGNNILVPYETGRTRDYGFFIGTGSLAKSLMASITASYEFLPNIYFDVNATIRRFSQENLPKFNTNIFSTGIRMNLGRREFEF